MKCDQCGCEHSSRSVCPKCGAPVIYVNEDYKRRKQEWEEAQKNGNANVLPPGIRYSTKEEHDRAAGRDRMTENYEEGMSETAGLPLSAWKERGLALAAKVGERIKKCVRKLKKKKRGAENKVIRKIDFDEETQTVKTPKPAVRRKKAAARRKKLTAGIFAGAVLVAAAVVAVGILLRIDRTRVMVFDGHGYFAVADPETLFFHTEGEDAEILAVSPDGEKVLFETAGKIYLYRDGAAQLLETAENAVVTGEAYFDETGAYYAFVECVAENMYDGSESSYDAADTEETYILYVGSVSDGLLGTVDNSFCKTVLEVSSDATVLYVNQETAAYGLMVNATVAQFYPETGKETVIVDTFTDYRYIAAQRALYYIRDERLYRTDLPGDGKSVLLDEEVLAFSEDMTQALDGIFYEKENGYYYMETAMEEPLLFARTTVSSLKFCYDRKEGFIYATDGTTMYRIETVGAKPQTVCELLDKTALYNAEDHFLITISKEGILYQLDGQITQLETGTGGLLPITNAEGFSYVKDGVRYLRSSPKSKEKVLTRLLEETAGTQLIASGGWYYFYDTDRILWKISKNGKICTSLGYVENCYFVD